jgi:putative membrane protein
MKMQKASDVINAEQRARVESAVSTAESKTSCEIVPVVATSSGRYDRAEDLVGLWFAMVGAVIAFLMFPGHTDHGTWGGIPLWGQVGLLVLVMLVCFIVGATLADRFRSLRLLFTLRSQMHEEVNLRARELFFDRRIHHTAGASGLLIFVSLYERTAVVLGDRSVVETLSEKFPEELCQRLTASLRSHDVATAICDTIQHAATSLQTALPRTSSDTNELPDALVLLD